MAVAARGRGDTSIQVDRQRGGQEAPPVGYLKKISSRCSAVWAWEDRTSGPPSSIGTGHEPAEARLAPNCEATNQTQVAGKDNLVFRET
jgi:hypothetical protein